MRESFERAYTGSELEMDLLGEGVKPAARYNGKYLKFSEAEELVKQNQPEGWDPEDPPVTPTKFPSDLYFTVQQEFEREFMERAANVKGNPWLKRRLDALQNQIKLKLWNASGSELDHDHGTDAFFTISVDQGKGLSPLEEMVTIDVTRNVQKTERGVKAEVIVYLPPGSSYDEFDEERQGKFLGEYSKQIAARLGLKAVRLIERKAA